jgi:tetratricopeptide (TPR) repeat protein
MNDPAKNAPQGDPTKDASQEDHAKSVETDAPAKATPQEEQSTKKLLKLFTAFLLVITLTAAVNTSVFLTELAWGDASFANGDYSTALNCYRASVSNAACVRDLLAGCLAPDLVACISHIPYMLFQDRSTELSLMRQAQIQNKFGSYNAARDLEKEAQRFNCTDLLLELKLAKVESLLGTSNYFDLEEAKDQIGEAKDIISHLNPRQVPPLLLADLHFFGGQIAFRDPNPQTEQILSTYYDPAFNTLPQSTSQKRIIALKSWILSDRASHMKDSPDKFKELELALALEKELPASHPIRIFTNLVYANAYEARKDYQNASHYYDEAKEVLDLLPIASSQSACQLYRDWAMCDLRLNKLIDARSHLDSAIQVADSNYLTKALAYCALGDLDASTKSGKCLEYYRDAENLMKTTDGYYYSNGHVQIIDRYLAHLTHGGSPTLINALKKERKQVVNGSSNRSIRKH